MSTEPPTATPAPTGTVAPLSELSLVYLTVAPTGVASSPVDSTFYPTGNTPQRGNPTMTHSPSKSPTKPPSSPTNDDAPASGLPAATGIELTPIYEYTNTSYLLTTPLDTDGETLQFK